MASGIFPARQKPRGGSGVLRRLKSAAANSPTAVLKGPQSSSAWSLRSRFRKLQKRKARILNREICEPREQSITKANLDLARFTWIEHDCLGFCNGDRARSPQRAAAVASGSTGTDSFAWQAAT
jgi:hypothetical protein